MKGRISFKAGAVQHIYQRTNNGFLIFYSVRDYLVLFTIIMTVAKQHKVNILGICFMVDHLHIMVEVDSRETLSSFVQHYTTWFSQEWNRHHGQSGSLFARQFGFASKDNNKSIRSAIAYLFNNPVEKELCARPEQARWNFLAYSTCQSPFSEQIKKVSARTVFRRALNLVDSAYRHGLPLGYTLIGRITEKLEKQEHLQITDYIITKYNAIDYQKTISYFGTYDRMITAVNTAKGSEYDIREVFTTGSDQIYATMTSALLRRGVISNIDELLKLPREQRQDCLYWLSMETGASFAKIAKYLHILL